VTPALDLLAGRPLVVLTGAGLSTDSGIPDYRGPGAPVRAPMTYQEFVSGPDAQRRYWARSHLGWARMHGAEPNAGHRALARLDPALLITQNVDGLHERAGSPNLVALHGRIAEVICLACRRISDRARLQERMSRRNPGHLSRFAAVTTRPDGDVDLDETDGFEVPGCEDCGGPLKPHVVFFGENVPTDRVERCYAAVDALAGPSQPSVRPNSTVRGAQLDNEGRADREGGVPDGVPDGAADGVPGGALLVAGSSLAVMSGLRFVRRAAQAGTPVVIVNRGATRGDDLASYKLEAGCSDFLIALAERAQPARAS
jgi:NAD-dependent SIR2 family protein deacetylase